MLPSSDALQQQGGAGARRRSAGATAPAACPTHGLPAQLLLSCLVAAAAPFAAATCCRCCCCGLLLRLFASRPTCPDSRAAAAAAAATAAVVVAAAAAAAASPVTAAAPPKGSAPPPPCRSPLSAPPPLLPPSWYKAKTAQPPAPWLAHLLQLAAPAAKAAGLGQVLAVRHNGVQALGQRVARHILLYCTWQGWLDSGCWEQVVGHSRRQKKQGRQHHTEGAAHASRHAAGCCRQLAGGPADACPIMPRQLQQKHVAQPLTCCRQTGSTTMATRRLRSCWGVGGHDSWVRVEHHASASAWPSSGKEAGRAAVGALQAMRRRRGGRGAAAGADGMVQCTTLLPSCRRGMQLSGSTPHANRL